MQRSLAVKAYDKDYEKTFDKRLRLWTNFAAHIKWKANFDLQNMWYV
jgi:hypothetical protein